MISFPERLLNKLHEVKSQNKFRTLKASYPVIDFSSNDYLGFSKSGKLQQRVSSLLASTNSGSTGSRLISGNSSLFNNTEDYITQFHHAESALIFNSGFDANLGLLSSVPQKGDLILSDELIHASLIDGIRLSFATHYKFSHNNIAQLNDLLERHHASFNEIYIVVESVYSMDGDSAPLIKILELAKHYHFHLIVDEAHAIGIFGNQGRGLCNELNIEDKCFARIYTYGKAMGCHGAAIVGSNQLKDYLINFSRSFIYTTALPEHSIISIRNAYELLINSKEITHLKTLISYFNTQTMADNSFIKSQSAIHCKIVPGNTQVSNLETKLSDLNFFVKSIKSPTVKENQERLRICLHSFNTIEEVNQLIHLITS